MLNIILFGPPGSGKGTQAQRLAENYGLLHVSTGDLFRYEMGHDTELGQLAKSYMAKGDLVPDEVTIGILTNKVDANPFVPGYILDGFPRTIAQSEALDKLLADRGQAVTGLIALDVPQEEIIQRILLRGKTSGRADDTNTNIIRNRIAVYQDETSPVFDYYGENGKTQMVDGVGTIDEIYERLCAVMDQLIDDVQGDSEE